jgi:F-type H+-transporting ATPase subunit epsilon
MNAFRLLVVAFDSTIWSGEAVYCGVTTLSGDLGLEAGHEPLLAVLREGSAITWRDRRGNEHTHPTAGGLLSFRDNACTVTMLSK